MSDNRFQLAVPNVLYALILSALSIIFPVAMWILLKQRGIEIVDFFPNLIHLTLLGAFLLYTPSTLFRGLEWLGWIFLSFTEWFYYEPIANSTLRSLEEIVPSIRENAEKFINFQQHFWELLRSYGPVDWPFNVGVSYWPIYILGLGLVLRAGIYRWGGARLMVHARAYWLWITLYLIV
ncbi:MAG: hypothetical protein ACHP6H_07150, partial [Legionellales bacterium]